MSDPRQPQDDPRAQPGSSDESGSSSTGSTSPDNMGWQAGAPAQSGSSWQASPQEPVSTDTIYQPAYTPPPASQQGYQQPANQPPTYQTPSVDQPPYQQQPGYPPAYAPPVGPSAPYQAPTSNWGQQWADQEPARVRHDHSLGVGIASVFLAALGLLFTLFGIGFLVLGAAIFQLAGQNAPFEPGQLEAARSGLVVVAIIALVIGIPHVLAAIWAPLHKNWARVVGIIVSVVGILLGILVLISPAQRSTVTQADGTTITTSFNPAIGSLFFLIPYGFTLAALILSRRHFRSG